MVTGLVCGFECLKRVKGRWILSLVLMESTLGLWNVVSVGAS